MHELILKNPVFFTLTALMLGSYFSNVGDANYFGVDFESMKYNNVRSVEVKSSEVYSKIKVNCSINDSGLLVKYSYYQYSLIKKKVVRKYSYNYEYDDRMFLTKEIFIDAKDTIVLNHIWTFLTPNILEVTDTGYIHIIGDGSPDTNVKAIPGNSITLSLDSNNHILSCVSVLRLQMPYATVQLGVNDTIKEIYSYNNKGQVERVHYSDNVGGRGNAPYCFFRYNDKGQIIEKISGDITNFNDTLNKNRIWNWTIRNYDQQNRLTKTMRKSVDEFNQHHTNFYTYDNRGRMINSNCEGNDCFYLSETKDYYDNGLIKKRVRKPNSEEKKLHTASYKYE